MQAALFVAACAAHSGCTARAPAPDTPATAAAARRRALALALRFPARIVRPAPPPGALRAEVAARAARAAWRRLSPRPAPRPPVRSCARASVLLAARVRAHARVQFADGPTRNCVLDGLRRFAILNAVEVEPRAPRSARVRGAERRRRLPRRALRDGTGAERAPPRRAACRGQHVPLPPRIGTSPFDPLSLTGARPPCPHFATSVTPGPPLRAPP
ncbi:hypothetical protein FEP95_03022 [Burkholderia multivorans]|nr:hypothetical protein [Burkholderia multivorans]MDR8807955.1 hypothetical protein [Burkholderia multivorans]